MLYIKFHYDSKNVFMLYMCVRGYRISNIVLISSICWEGTALLTYLYLLGGFHCLFFGFALLNINYLFYHLH